jgi:hypothetical protein
MHRYLSCVLTGAQSQSHQQTMFGVLYHACHSLCSSSVPALMPCGCARRSWRHARTWWSSASRARGQVTSPSVCLFMVVVGCVHSIETQTNKNQLKLSTVLHLPNHPRPASAILMPCLASSLRLRSLSRGSARYSYFFTVLSLTLLVSIADGLDLHLLVHGVLHPSPLTLSVWFSRCHTSGHSAEQNWLLCVIMTKPPSKSLMAPARAASESRSR